MNFSFRPALTLLLVASSATLLTACDYASLSPGENPQFREGFTNAPGYTNMDVNRDSINYKQNVHTPIGKGSAMAIKNGSAQDQLDSAPAGNSTSSAQTASGKMAPADQNQPKATGSTNGSGNSNDASAKKGNM
ncbi:hypothetical protein GCM10023172_05470 [Hymenobacter ginsengisoli]|uniref:Lipoprotein n=1 Tax=Hymenobacter ginsengisoli TaxID=1051626 RepID=A0ABP8PYC2_9BACT|nr:MULTISPECIES: hypothetical protein [unclassified Hymenobacter]MBO2030649.1 hypothetical protein [Hymenobacter sp. BT559]